MLTEDTLSDITINVQNDVPLHGYKPEDVLFIRLSPHEQQSAVRQSDADPVVLSNVSEIIQSGLLTSYCWKFVCQSLS